MNKTKFFIFLAAALFVSNLILIAFLILRKQQPPFAEPKTVVIKKLNFDDQQIIAYEILIKAHRADIITAENRIITLKKTLYSLLNQENIQAKDSLVNELALEQKKIENCHFKHFQDIKKLCKPEQMTLFETFSKDITNIFSQKPKRKKQL